MILGIGSDLCDARRIGATLKRFGARFLDRTYTQEEQARLLGLKDQDRYLAKRFAAKEAVAKALGSGFRDGVSWTDIGVSKDALSRPRIVLTGGALRRLTKITPDEYDAIVHLTLTDEGDLAQAFVVIEARHKPFSPARSASDVGMGA